MNAKGEKIMNEMLKKAHAPELEIGEVCEINDLWDGNGDCPRDSYSYPIADNNWINYVFEVIEEKENALDTVIKITGIELL